MINELQISEDLKLLPVNSEDAESIFELVERNRCHLREWLPWLDIHTTIEDTNYFIERSSKQAAENSAQVMTIMFRGSLCGVIGFNYIDSLSRICEIGYWIDADHQGLGIVTRSTRILIELAFTDLGMNKVCIPVAQENRRSRRVPERLGFVSEGIARDAEWLYDHFVNYVLYALLKSDWNSSDEQKIVVV